MRRVAFLCILLYTVIDIIASPLDVLLANIALHGVALEAQPQAGPFSFGLTGAGLIGSFFPLPLVPFRLSARRSHSV